MTLATRAIQLGLAAALTLSSSLAIAAEKVLIVVTSHSQMGTTSEKTGYWLGEVTHPYKELVDAGIEIRDTPGAPSSFTIPGDFDESVLDGLAS